MSTDPDVHERLVRIETKLDSFATGTGDHEARIRTLESRRTVSPAQLWGAFGGLVGVLVGLTVLTRFVVEVILK